MKKSIILFCVTVLLACNARRPAIKTGFEGKPLPAFDLLLNDSTTVMNTGSIPAGKPIVLIYFSPRCPFCRAQMDGIVKDIAELKDIRFYIFTTWPFREMKDFYKHYRLDKYPNISVGVDYNNFFSDRFKITGVPYMAIYRKDKKLNEAFMGNINSQQIKEVAEN